MRHNTPTAYQEESYSWPDLKELFAPMKQYIISIHTRSAFGVKQAIIRFDNGYGLNMFRDQESKNPILEMVVVKFHGEAVNEYKFLHSGISIPDLTLGHAKDDILELCERVSLL
jgi:hypothetical protein